MLLFKELLALEPVFLFYSDPGSGALILQLLVSTFLGGLFYLRKFKHFLFKKKAPVNTERSIREKS